MKGDDACILALQLDLLIDIRRMICFLRRIRLLSFRPSPGDGAPPLGGVGKLADAFFSVLVFFQIFVLSIRLFDLADMRLTMLQDGSAICRQVMRYFMHGE
jgi:hypothetical protein